MEVHDDQQINEHDRAENSIEHALVSALHCFDLTEHRDRLPLDQIALGIVDDLLHIGSNSAQIPALRRGIDLHHRLNIVLRDDRITHVAFNRGNRAQNLRATGARRRDRQIFQRRQAIH